MCGIFGWISDNNNGVRRVAELVNDCFRMLNHRGPDDRGLMYFHPKQGWQDQKDEINEGTHLLLGHVRLSILDLSSLGKQPMMTEDGRFRITYNGELYNYRELRQELEIKGMVFSTQTDTEVVLKAFALWGLGCLTRFTGMFAMAIHDDKDKKIYLIRDHFGIKPLFYTSTSTGNIFFASELQVLLTFPDVSRVISSQRAYDYLLFSDYDSHEETMVQGIYNVLPGHYLVIDSSTARILQNTRYWQLNLDIQCQLNFDDAAEKLRNMFLDNIRLHLRSDVPFGAALSGGVDSSAVTCAIRYLEPEIDLPSFSYIASGRRS